MCRGFDQHDVEGSMRHNVCIYAIKSNIMKATSLGIWYRQIPGGFIVDPQGEVVEPKIHNGSKFIYKNGERIPISKIPELDYYSALRFRNVFC